MIALTSSACAAGEYAGVTVEVDGWTLIPVHDSIATTHMIALRDDDELRMTDIDSVLYTRTPTGWDGAAYAPGVSKEDALVDMAADLGLSDPMALDWELNIQAADLTGGQVERAAFGSGFFASDPLYAAATAMDDPEPLAEMIETLGGASASSAANTTKNPVGDPIPGNTGDCDNDSGGCLIAPQESIAFGIDAMLAGQASDIIEAEGLANDHDLAFSCCCRPSTWTNWLGPWSSWDCVGGTSATWQFDLWYLSSTGQQKTCQFKRLVYRSQQRTRVKRCFNCNQYAVHQTRTEYGWQVDQAAPVLATDPCPSSPSSSMLCTDPPNGWHFGYWNTTTPWGPPLPPC